MITQKASDRATEWYLTHQKHVNTIREETWNCYPPSQEDMNDPALWKPAHWNWFIDVYYNE